MTTSQGDKPEVMLKAVVEKARKNGWVYPKQRNFLIDNPYYVKEVLFDHSFAKAYWGEELLYTDKDDGSGAYPKTYGPAKWQHHLQQAVLSENPLLYYFERL